MEEKLKRDISKLNIYKDNFNSNIDFILNNYAESIENIELLKDRCSLINTLIKEYNIKYTLDIIKQKLNIDLSHTLRSELRCCLIFINYLLTNNVNKVVYELKSNNEFLERLYIRIMLLKSGWIDFSIEKFIKKYYKGDYTIKYYKNYYLIIKRMLGITNTTHFKGRPSFPNEIRDIIKEYRKEKMRKTMNEKYNISKDLNKLFTLEDINDIYCLIETSNLINKKQLKDKLYILNKYN